MPSESERDTDFVDSEQTIDFQEIYYLLRSKAWIAVVCAVLALLLGSAYVISSPKIYSSKTIVQVDQEPRKVVKIEGVTAQDLNSLEVLKTIEQNLSSGALLQAVIEDLKLAPRQLGLPDRPRSSFSQNQLIGQLQNSTSAKLVRGTRLITITAENRDPQLAQQISLGIVKQYIRRNFAEQLAISREVNRFLEEESARLKQKLEKSEQALQAYKERTQAVSLEDTQNITVEKLKELNAKVTEAKTQRLKLEADYAQVQKIGTEKPDELLAIPSVAASQDVLEQRKRLAEQEGEVANLSQRYGSLHPKYIQAQSQLQELKAGWNRAVAHAAQSLGNAYAAAKETETKFDQALTDQEQKALQLNKLAIPYNVLAREVESDRALYESVLTRLKETNVTQRLEQDNIHIVEPARVPDRPSKPRSKLILAGSLLLGLVVGLGSVLGLNSFDKSLKTVDQAEARLKLPAVGAVPNSDKPIALDHGLVTMQDPHGGIAEAFRTLRTSLSLLGQESERRTFLFTSAVPGEGKSFCAINYAVALAQQGLRTLLIDADLRVPAINKIFFEGKVDAGVSNVIAGQMPFSEAVRPSTNSSLYLLTAGHRAPNPAELLSGSGFAELIKSVLGHFDRVVVDSAPVNPVSDTLLLVKHIQSVCLVIYAGKTPDKVVIRACHKLEEAGAKPVGFVLNRLPPRAGAGYHYHYSDGEYGRGIYGAAEAMDADSPSGPAMERKFFSGATAIPTEKDRENRGSPSDGVATNRGNGNVKSVQEMSKPK